MRMRIRVDRRTKALPGRCRPGDAALVCHADLDEVAATALADAGVAAVLNTEPFLSGRYAARGAAVLLRRGVRLVEGLGSGCLQQLHEGELVDLRDGQVWRSGRLVACGRPLGAGEAAARAAAAERHHAAELAAFVQNTLARAQEEAPGVLAPLPNLGVDLGLRGRPAVVVVRGPDYQADLAMLLPFIRRRRPALVAVDGAADALARRGLHPDLIVGDMDSVGDRALAGCPLRVAHAYPQGGSPGLDRCRRLGLPALSLAAPGTSEDLALRLAYEAGARPLILVGGHTGLTDFLEKGRPGMASTLLVRLKVGHALIDAKGGSRLYGPGPRRSPLPWLVAAALVPAVAAALLSPALRLLLTLWSVQVRLALGI